MSNARDTETSPFTTEQNQRAEAVACAVAALGQIRQHDDRVAAYEVVQVAEFITGHPHHTIDAEFVGDAPEPDDDEMCDIGGCERPIRGVPRTVMDYTDRLCSVHANAPEPEAGDASETVKVTECQWPGCDNRALSVDPPTFRVLYQGVTTCVYDACINHAGRRLSERTT